MIATFDLASLLATLAALAVILLRWRGMLRGLETIFLLALLALTAVVDFGNLLQWSGVSGFFERFEDHLEVMVASLWGALFITFIQGRYEEEVAHTEREYRDLVEGANSIILRADHEGRITFINPYGEDFFGFSRGELNGRLLVGSIVPPRDSRGKDLAEMIGGILTTPERYATNENENMRRDGSRVWVNWSNRSVFDHRGRLKEVLCVGHDVTERLRAVDQLRASLQEKEVLLKEVHHRVKNNLQVISGLLNLQEGPVADPGARAFIKESQGRVASMALIHEELYRSGDLAQVDFGQYLERLARNLLVSYSAGPERVSLATELSSRGLVVDTAIPCALIVNELVSNALKHAFPAGRRGVLGLHFSQEGGVYRMEVWDDGVGMPPGMDIRRAHSLGMRLVTLLADQLKAELTVDRPPQGGTRFRLRFREYREAGTAMH